LASAIVKHVPICSVKANENWYHVSRPQFSKIWSGIFSFFIIFCIWIMLVNNFLDPVKNPIKIWNIKNWCIIHFNLIRPTLQFTDYSIFLYIPGLTWKIEAFWRVISLERYNLSCACRIQQ
jgi:hypothetical protein